MILYHVWWWTSDLPPPRNSGLRLSPPYFPWVWGSGPWTGPAGPAGPVLECDQYPHLLEIRGRMNNSWEKRRRVRENHYQVWSREKATEVVAEEVITLTLRKPALSEERTFTSTLRSVLQSQSFRLTPLQILSTLIHIQLCDRTSYRPDIPTASNLKACSLPGKNRGYRCDTAGSTLHTRGEREQ